MSQPAQPLSPLADVSEPSSPSHFSLPADYTLPAHLNNDDIRTHLELINSRFDDMDEVMQWADSVRANITEAIYKLLQSAPASLDVGEVITVLRKAQAIKDYMIGGAIAKKEIAARKKRRA